MAKKSFEDMDTAPAYTNVEDATAEPVKERRPRREYNQFEAQMLAVEGRTQGRKGAHLERFNIALSPANAQYVRIMSRMSAKPTTRFIDDILTQHRLKNSEMYEKAQLVAREFDNNGVL